MMRANRDSNPFIPSSKNTDTTLDRFAHRERRQPLPVLKKSIEVRRPILTDQIVNRLLYPFRYQQMRILP